MGAILNMSHSDVTESILTLQSELLKNPFYLFTDKKAIPVEYYNINTTRSTLDIGTRQQYSNLGKDCPYRFNLIHDFYIYGLDRVATSLENGDFGIESSSIAGDGIILPNTIQPYPGDYFIIKMLKQTYLFQISAVHTDTFEDGGNYWRVEYDIDHNDADELNPLVVDEFNFISGNIGTNYAPVLKSRSLEVCKIFDDAAVALKNYYRSLYYNPKVQTYTFTFARRELSYSMAADYFYDPYVIEFIIKNKILRNNGERYDYVGHKTPLRSDFPIKYSKSIWKVLEDKNLSGIHGCRYSSMAAYIDEPGTIFDTRYENFFELTYNEQNIALDYVTPTIFILEAQVIGHIENDQLFDQNSKYAKYNILVKYFNSEEITAEDIIPFERIMEVDNTYENFFIIPMAIFIIERHIKEMMASLSKD